MKKPLKGERKQVQVRNAKKRFVSKSERAKRKEKYLLRKRYEANIQKKYFELMNKIVQQQMSEIPVEEDNSQEETNKALFDGEESVDNI
jgi:hypothetical protein